MELTGDWMIHPMCVIDPLQCWLIQSFVQQLKKFSRIKLGSKDETEVVVWISKRHPPAHKTS